MSDMTTILRNTMRDHRVLWEIGLDDDCEIVAKCESCGYLGAELETWEHQANVASEILSAAGFGPVQENMRPMTLVEIERRDNPKQMEAARLQIRAEARAQRNAELREARAEAWDEGYDKGTDLCAWAISNRTDMERPDTTNPYRTEASS